MRRHYSNGNVSRQEEMMLRLQELSFALKETELFLDGHPENRRALAYYAETKGEYDLLAAEYEKTYAPITPGAAENATAWNWVRTPWPWEYGFPDGGDISFAPSCGGEE